MTIRHAVEKKFRDTFRTEPLLVRSPGRVNLIGEHTDYNLGFVLPAAIDMAIYFAIAPRADDHCVIHSLDMEDVCEFDIASIRRSEQVWPNYLLGVVDQMLRSHHPVHGFNCVFGGDIPIGAGLSSSAAMEAGFAFSLDHLFRLGIAKLDLVKMAQKAENEFVGVQCGIMDQYINIFGAENRVLKIDCRSLEYDYIPFESADVAIVLFDTRVSHSLASSEYNQRRRECAEGVGLLDAHYGGIQSLRDVTPGMLREMKDRMSDTVYRRCMFVVEENDRLLNGCAALRAGDMYAFGRLMYRSHEGLSREYEVSCLELDFLVELTVGHPNVYGARMMGGGFGGCTINLMHKDAVRTLGAIAAFEYKHTFGRDMTMYVTAISGGSHILQSEHDAAV